MHVLRRIKYYHLPCQKYSSNLSCFYDDLHICLCYDYGQQCLANYFDFNHNMKFDCLACYYGTRCQFSSSRFGLSLDTILGCYIQPYIGLIHQPNIIFIVTQMEHISNRLFLQIQCMSLDFLLQVCVNMDQWLNAFVAIERTMTIIKATDF
ncbi:unnamed protein product [Rotaria sp. Silwood1]|nr:unnamed protein product [Rotaria sp. Silwood1]CAF4507245.1 unnamed protein product [Rotaria sp. Silwood1]